MISIFLSHGWLLSSQSESYITSDSQPVYLGVKSHVGPKTRFLLLSDSCRFIDVGCPLWREDGSVIYNCCWLMPAQPFSGLSSAELMIILYCLRFKSPPTWRTRSPYLYPSEIGWPSYTPRRWVLFSSPPRTCGATVEVLDWTCLHMGCVCPVLLVHVI
jgi:hypothetical protein